MAGEWKEKKLEQVLSFSNGKFSPERFDNLPFPVYGSNGIIGMAGKSNSGPNTIIIGRVGSYCGALYFSHQECWVTDNAIRAVALNNNSPSYLYYLIKTLRLNQLKGGSGQPLINQSTLNMIPVRMPPYSEQRAIACILGAMDDKIELNRRMNRTLEEMARAIFKSWFVDFDPVRAKAAGRDPGLPKKIADLFPDSFQDSELGQIPKGWKVSPLCELIQINPTRKLLKGSLAPYLDMANMPIQGPYPGSWVVREMGSGMKFINGDTLVARITPCLENGKTAYVNFLDEGQVGWGSTEYIVLRPKKGIPPVFAYLLARTEDFRNFAIKQMTGSSGRQRVPSDSISNYSISSPNIESLIFKNFGEIVAPFFERIKSAMLQSRTLAALRDALLPKLISGELRVPDAERIVGRCV